LRVKRGFSFTLVNDPHWDFFVSVAPASENPLYPILWMANRELQQNIGEKETSIHLLYSNFNDILTMAAGMFFIMIDASLITLFKTKNDCFI
jgi:hypothetical protein